MSSPKRDEFERIRTDKKTNMGYWDLIDDISEKLVKEVVELSTKPIKLPEDMTMDDLTLEVGKMLTEQLIDCLEQNYGAEFPYVDENY